MGGGWETAHVGCGGCRLAVECGRRKNKTKLAALLLVVVVAVCCCCCCRKFDQIAVWFLWLPEPNVKWKIKERQGRAAEVGRGEGVKG